MSRRTLLAIKDWTFVVVMLSTVYIFAQLPPGAPPKPPVKPQVTPKHLEVDYQYKNEAETNWVTDASLVETNSAWTNQFNTPNFFGVRTVETNGEFAKAYQCSTNLLTTSWMTVGVFDEGDYNDYLFQTKLTQILETNMVYAFYRPLYWTNNVKTNAASGGFRQHQ